MSRSKTLPKVVNVLLKNPASQTSQTCLTSTIGQNIGRYQWHMYYSNHLSLPLSGDGVNQ